MRSRTSGSAISSPWRGGTTSGSTRASPAGCSPRRPSTSIPIGRSGSTAMSAKQRAMAADARRTDAPDPAGGRRRDRGDGGVRRHHLQQGPGLHPHARKLSRRGRVPRRHPPLHAGARLQQRHDRRSVARARSGVRQAGGGDRGRLHRAGRRSARHQRETRCAGDRQSISAAAGALHHPRSGRRSRNAGRCRSRAGPLRATPPAGTRAAERRNHGASPPAAAASRSSSMSATSAITACNTTTRCSRRSPVGWRRCAPADRVNLLADTWALVEAGRAEPARLLRAGRRARRRRPPRRRGSRSIRTLDRIDHLQWDRAGPARLPGLCQGETAPGLRPARMGARSVGEPADRGLLRQRLIRALGDLGDEDIIGEAKRRFAAFLANPDSLPLGLRESGHAPCRPHRRPRDLRDPHGARRAKRPTRISACATIRRSPAPSIRSWPRETLAIALTDELPTNLVSSLFYWVAWDGEHAELAWTFIKTNFAALAAKQGPISAPTSLPTS